MIAESCKTAESKPSPVMLLANGKLSRPHYLAMCRVMLESHISLLQAMKLHKQLYVEAAIEMTRGNRVKAARLLGSHRNTILRVKGRKP